MGRWLWVLIPAAFLVGAVALARATADMRYLVPAEPGALLYAATFDDYLDEWQQYEGRLAAQVTDGVLRMEVGDVLSGPYSVAEPAFTDFDARVQARASAGPVDNGFGMIFRLQDRGNTDIDDNSYYLFLISSDGYYRVVRVLEGQQRVLSDWIPSDAISLGLNALNTVRVAARGSSFNFFINDTPVELCLPDDPNAQSTFDALGNCVGGAMTLTLTDSSIPNGQLGVVAISTETGGAGVVVDFDNLLVFGPEVEAA